MDALASRLRSASHILAALGCQWPWANPTAYSVWVGGVVSRLARAHYSGPAAPVIMLGPKGSGKSLAAYVAARCCGEKLVRLPIGRVGEERTGSYHLLVAYRGCPIGQLPTLAQVWVETLTMPVAGDCQGALVCALNDVTPEDAPVFAQHSLLDANDAERLAPGLRDLASAVVRKLGLPYGPWDAVVPAVTHAFVRGVL